MPFEKPTNRAEFDKFLSKTEKIIIVYITTLDGNEHCEEKIRPMLQSLDKAHPGNTFVEVDVDKLKDGERIFEEQLPANADIEAIKDQLETRFLDVK